MLIFNSDQLYLLNKIYNDLLEKSNNPKTEGISKDIFLHYIPLKGELGDKLFYMFDTKNRNYINYDDFLLGLSILFSNNKDLQSKFISDMLISLDIVNLLESISITITNKNNFSQDILNYILSLIPFNITQRQISSKKIDILPQCNSESYESYLWKKGMYTKFLVKRYYLLYGNYLYYYDHKKNIRPKEVIFLSGAIIKEVDNEQIHNVNNMFAFEISQLNLCTNTHYPHENRILYCKSKELQDEWIKKLNNASHVISFEDEYILGKEIGSGAFSKVYTCTKSTNKEKDYAVKIIDKSKLNDVEKYSVKSEIAILKLVNHPNIINIKYNYESKNYVYIVTEYVQGGDLFDKLVGEPKLTELELYKLILPLLEAVCYLHELGIIHRDIKLENILYDNGVIKLSDFGLSKLLIPGEKIDVACGTLDYASPELLLGDGYGVETDIWSIGIIMHILLYGKIPFNGENEIINKDITPDNNLISLMLDKNPTSRITAKNSISLLNTLLSNN